MLNVELGQKYANLGLKIRDHIPELIEHMEALDQSIPMMTDYSNKNKICLASQATLP